MSWLKVLLFSGVLGARVPKIARKWNQSNVDCILLQERSLCQGKVAADPLESVRLLVAQYRIELEGHGGSGRIALPDEVMLAENWSDRLNAKRSDENLAEYPLSNTTKRFQARCLPR